MSFDANGNWINDGVGGVKGSSPASVTGPMTNGAGFWDALDNPGPMTNATAGFGPRGSNTPPMMLGPMNNSAGGGSIADQFRAFGMANGGDPSAVNDPNYWAGIYNEKVSKGADPTETFNYLTGRITNGSGGSGGFGGGSFTPLPTFQYGGTFSQFSAPTVGAGSPFSYTGPQLGGPPPALNFPGVYAPPTPPTPATAESSAPVENPYGKDQGNGFVLLSNGAMVPKDHPLAAEFNNWQPPAAPKAASAPSNSNLAATPEGSEPGQLSPGGSRTFNENTGASYTAGPMGPGGVPMFAPPSPAPLPGPFTGAGNVPAPYQATPFSYNNAVPQGYQAQNFSYSTPVPQGYQPQTFSYDQALPQAYQATPFQYDQGLPAGYAPGTFTDTTAADLANDPGYQFRQDQQRKAIEQSAAGRGTLNSTGTLKALADYSGQLASQEFGNVDARRRNTFAQNEANRLSAAQQAQSLQAQGYAQAANTAGLNAAQQQAAAQSAQGLQQQGYAQALGTAGFNQANQQTAAAQGLAAQQQGYEQAIGAAGLNAANQQAQGAQALAGQQQGYQQALGAAGLNAANQQAAAQSAAANQAQAYGQAANTYTTNYGNLFNQNQANFQNALGVFGANQGAQNQAFNQALAQAGFNAQTPLAYQQQAWNQQYQPWQQQAANSLQAGITNAQMANATNNLNAGQQWNQFQSQWLPYQSSVDQALQAANNGLGWANYGLNANQQGFNQNLATFNTNYQTQVTDPWNQQFALAQLGANAGSGLGNYGMNYGNQVGDLYTGQGNAQAGAGIASGNAFQSALGALGQAPLYAYGLYNQPRYNSTNTQAPTPGWAGTGY